jgi:hypothetical protein
MVILCCCGREQPLEYSTDCHALTLLKQCQIGVQVTHSQMNCFRTSTSRCASGWIDTTLELLRVGRRFSGENAPEEAVALGASFAFAAVDRDSIRAEKVEEVMNGECDVVGPVHDLGNTPFGVRRVKLRPRRGKSSVVLASLLAKRVSFRKLCALPS